MKLIDGKETANEIKKELAAQVAEMIDTDDRRPHLAAILVGEDAASQTYVNAKEKACKEVGFMSSIYKLPSNASEKEVLDLVDFLNNDPEVDGFIVQLPLPGQIDENKVIQRIKPDKDVDGFHPVNFGRMALNLPAYIS
ncbi:MAG: tetrahydrofolate dehydrogenase/cyclohydrolase catalytic domain-containing protein, partial [Bacteroidales bacterium]